MEGNWTFDHDDHAPFGSDEHINLTEYHSLLITIMKKTIVKIVHNISGASNNRAVR